MKRNWSQFLFYNILKFPAFCAARFPYKGYGGSQVCCLAECATAREKICERILTNTYKHFHQHFHYTWHMSLLKIDNVQKHTNVHKQVMRSTTFSQVIGAQNVTSIETSLNNVSYHNTAN